MAAFREVLLEYTRERAPLDWAMTQNNLGTVLWRLRRTEEAIAAFREALKERTRERVPLQWAATQSNLGNALGALGGRESGTAKLEEAVAAYREALKEYTRERAAPEWATTQNNLGVELRRLGERESGTAKLEEAVAAFREALKERTRERMPIEWAQSFGNEGVALILLAERRADVTMAEAALNQINTAFEVTREHVAPSAVLRNAAPDGADGCCPAARQMRSAQVPLPALSPSTAQSDGRARRTMPTSACPRSLRLDARELITLVHLSIFSAMNFANSSGEFGGTATAP